MKIDDQILIEHLRDRVKDSSNRLQNKHVDIIERRLLESKLDTSASSPFPAPLETKEGPSFTTLYTNYLLLGAISVFLLIAGQVDLVDLFEVFKSYAFN